MCSYTVCVRISSIFYSISDSMAGSSWTAYSTSYDHLPIPTLSKLEIRPECFIPSENWPWNNRIDFDNLPVSMDR